MAPRKRTGLSASLSKGEGADCLPPYQGNPRASRGHLRGRHQSKHFERAGTRAVAKGATHDEGLRLPVDLRFNGEAAGSGVDAHPQIEQLDAARLVGVRVRVRVRGLGLGLGLGRLRKAR